VALQAVSDCNTLLTPFLPHAAQKIHELLGGTGVHAPMPSIVEVSDPDGTKKEWMVEGGTPNTLLRRGITRESLKPGTVLVIDGYQARDHSLLRANGRNVTYPDGRKLFLGSTGTGAPTDGADPTEAPKPGQRGRGGQ